MVKNLHSEMFIFFLPEECFVCMIFIISMKCSRIRIVMLFCILDVIFSVKEIFLFCHLRIKGGLFLRDLRFKSGHLKKGLSASLKTIWC